MKTLIHKLEVKKDQEKFMFQLPLPRNAISIRGIRLVFFDPKFFLQAGRKIPTSNIMASLYLTVANEQNNFFVEDLTLPINTQYNQEAFKPINTFLKQSNSPWMSGTREEYFHLNVPLTINMIEGFFENQFPLLTKDTYEVFIYLKLEI